MARILVAEDESIVAEDIQDILQNLGWSVAGIVSSGEEAISKAAETRPDLVLMDIMLDGKMDGVDAAQAIRTRFDIPVVYLTAYADHDTLQRAKLTGPYGYVVKPFEERDLNAAVEIALHKHQIDSRLSRREWWLSSALSSIGDAVIAVDSDECVTFMNPVALDLTGRQLNEAQGKPLGQVLSISSKEKPASSHNPIRRVLRDGVVVALADHRAIIPENGTHIGIDGSSGPIRDETGTIVGALLVFRAVTQREPGTLSHALKKGSRSAASRARHVTTGSRSRFETIVTRNGEIQRMLDLLPDIARSDSTVLIEGPSGSGKELFARAIHNLSARRNRDYVVVSCGALPDTLLESELFGYVKGAFTDARKDKPGRFALAEGGTIFLDEIGDISTALQAKLLRVLEQKEYEPLGATATVKADVRVIAATNKSLPELVSRGLFRDDLFYRLNVVKLLLPPLASRREDIPLLIEHCIRKFNHRTGKDIRCGSPEVLAILTEYDFPGNVRELENIIEHAFIMCHGTVIEREHLPEELLARTLKLENEAAQSPLRGAEAQAIFRALHKHHGNRGETAAYLGIDKSTLWRKMKKYGISYKTPRSGSLR